MTSASRRIEQIGHIRLSCTKIYDHKYTCVPEIKKIGDQSAKQKINISLINKQQKCQLEVTELIILLLIKQYLVILKVHSKMIFKLNKKLIIVTM